MPCGPVYAVVLAAGRSRRFGCDKLLSDLRGKPVISHVVQVIRESRNARLVAGGIAVTALGGDDLAKIFAAEDLDVLENRDPDAGLSRSLTLGLDALADRYPESAGALIFPGDQPAVRLSVVRSIVETWRLGSRPVVRPRYLDQRESPGHPVLVSREVWKLGGTVTGDHGFGQILTSYPELVTIVDVPGTNPDIDTPDDLRRLAENL